MADILNEILSGQQAAEKSIKAAIFMRNYEGISHHNLGQLAAVTGNSELIFYGNRMESLLRGSSAMRYPDRWCPPSIPHDKYDEQKAVDALDIAERIVDEVEKIIDN